MTDEQKARMEALIKEAFDRGVRHGSAQLSAAEAEIRELKARLATAEYNLESAYLNDHPLTAEEGLRRAKESVAFWEWHMATLASPPPSPAPAQPSVISDEEFADWHRAVGVEPPAAPAPAQPEATAEPVAPWVPKVRDAIEALESTRWNPPGDLTTWSRTTDGQNHAAVMRALVALRGPLLSVEPAPPAPPAAPSEPNPLTGWRRNPRPELAGDCRHKWVARDGSCVDCDAAGILESLEPAPAPDLSGRVRAAVDLETRLIAALRKVGPQTTVGYRFRLLADELEKSRNA